MPVPRNQEETFLAPLTEKEREVLASVVHGGSTRELASVLFLSEQSVKFHLSHIYEKLEVTNRPELLSLYWQTVLRDVEADRDEALEALADQRQRLSFSEDEDKNFCGIFWEQHQDGWKLVLS